MKSLKKIAGYNLLAIVVYSALIRLGTGGNHLAIAIYSAFVVGAHVVISLIVSAITAGNAQKDQAKAWLLSALIVLLVGFSTCLGNASI